MDTKFVNIGFGNVVAIEKIVSIVNPDSAPIKRLIQEARDLKMLVDATYGRKTRGVIITSSSHVIVTSLQPETLTNRLI